MGATINKHTSMLTTLRVNRAAALSVIRKRPNIAAAYSRMREELAQTCSPANSDRDALRNSSFLNHDWQEARRGQKRRTERRWLLDDRNQVLIAKQQFPRATSGPIHHEYLLGIRHDRKGRMDPERTV